MGANNCNAQVTILDSTKISKAKELVSLTVWNKLFFKCQYKRTPGKAVHLLESMILQWNPPPTLVSFNTVIDTCTKTKGYLQQAFLVYWNMQRLGFQPNVVTFTSLIIGCGKEGQPGTALSLFHQMEFAGPAPNQFTYNAVIHVSAKVGHFHCAASMINSMLSEGYVLETMNLTAVVHALAEVGFLDLALHGLHCMMDFGIEVNMATFDGILRSCIRQKQADIASHLTCIQEMRAHQIRPRQGTVDALGSVSRNVKAERAQFWKSADSMSTNTNTAAQQ